ncbi:MAG TPA: cell wall metabolism sensor histidine kinase WalK, partial [Candidatus Mediterraneibacter norfolkensis]|nr:cell wall metabolism sensor histidine kinase WalK [Candidatus Mediterraneibacter norfolkensis]
MYIQSGEWVIISRVKSRFKFKDKIFRNLRFRIILIVMLAGLVPCIAALFGIVNFYESRTVSLRTAEIQNQCTILGNQLNNYGYFEEPSSEIVNANLYQMATIYSGRIMVIDQDLKVIRDTYGLDEGKTDVSENVVRCMRGESTNYYDTKNHYIEVTSPITETGGDQVIGVIQASIPTDSIEVSV